MLYSVALLTKKLPYAFKYYIYASRRRADYFLAQLTGHHGQIKHKHVRDPASSFKVTSCWQKWEYFVSGAKSVFGTWTTFRVTNYFCHKVIEEKIIA